MGTDWGSESAQKFLQVPAGTSVREVEGGFMLIPSEGRLRKITVQDLERAAVGAALSRSFQSLKPSSSTLEAWPGGSLRTLRRMIEVVLTARNMKH